MSDYRSDVCHRRKSSETDFDPTLTEIFPDAKDEVLALMRQNREDAPSPR